MNLVRWGRRNGQPGQTLWHIDTPVLHDTEGRTGCGKRYPRRSAEVRPAEEVTGLRCEACEAAVRSEPEAPDAD